MNDASAVPQHYMNQTTDNFLHISLRTFATLSLGTDRNSRDDYRQSTFASVIMLLSRLTWSWSSTNHLVADSDCNDNGMSGNRKSRFLRRHVLFSTLSA
jgi:hypothetical protein